MDMEIIACKSIGPIKLGMTPEEVQQALDGCEYEVFTTYEESSSGLAEHSFKGLPIKVEYRKPGVCVFVEMAKPFNPTLQGRPLLSTPFSTLAEWFKDVDPETKVDTSGLESPALGISIYAPGHDESPENHAEGAGLFEKDYYTTAFSVAVEQHLADYEVAKKKYGPDDPKTRECALDLCSNYAASGKKEEAAKWRKIWLEGE